MKTLLLVPVLVFAACAGNEDRDVVDGTLEGDVPPDGPSMPETPDGPALAFSGGYIYEPSDCADHSVRLEAHYGYADGTRPDVVNCVYALSDGTVIATTCGATVPLPEAKVVNLTITDPATGAVATHTDVVQGPLSFATTADVTSDGLSISWDAHTMYGATADVGAVLVSISPAENVIVSDPMDLEKFAGSVAVTAPGTYTVTVSGSIRFADVGGCASVVEHTLELHEPHDDCDDPMHAH